MSAQKPTKNQLLQEARQLQSDADLIKTANPDEAVVLYNDAAEKMAEAGDIHESARILDQMIGPILYRSGKIREALGIWHQSLSAYEKTQDVKGQADVNNKIAVMHSTMAEYSTALEFTVQSLRLAEESQNDFIVEKALNNQGIIYKELGSYDLAVEKFRQSLDLKSKSGDRLGQANTLNNMGNLYKVLGDLKEAVSAFKRSRDFFEELHADAPDDERFLFGLAAVNHDLGNLYLQENNLEGALEQYRKSLGFNRDRGRIGSLFADYRDIAEIYIRQGNFSSAESFLKQAKQLADDSGMENFQYKVHQSMAGLHVEKGELPEAIESFKTAIIILEKIRGSLAYERHQTGFMKGVLDIYSSIIIYLVELKRYEEAFNYLEMMKARALLDVLEGGFVDFRDIMSPEEVDKEKELLSQLEKMNTTIANLRSFQQKEFASVTSLRDVKRRELQTFEENLYITHPDLKDRRGRGEPVTFPRAGNLMSRDEVAVYYLLSEDQLTIFVVSRKDLQVMTVEKPAKDIESAVRRLQHPTPEWDIQASQELYEQLISPIEPWITDVNRLCIIPEGILNSLPFQALQNPKTGKYLIESHAVYYVQSLSTLRSVRSLGNYGSSTLLGFGDPQFNPQQASRSEWSDKAMPITPLPATGEELKALQEVYHNQATIFTGADATKSNFTRHAGDFGVLHFATHAFTDEQNPMHSAIALAQEGDEYSFLEAREIIQMELNADLVVLSACRTAGGKLIAGEGMQGLSRAFFTAGVPTVIASLWNVDDHSTRELMVQFHTRFRNRERLATALREAQLHLLQNTEFSSPFYWAPFVLIGDSE